jgi:predicted DNA-binding transcriptional regulator YafY
VEYCLLSRDFDIAELKLLVDAVQSARFISESMTDKLIRKLEQLTSKRMAGKLHRQVHFTGRVKTRNEHVHYTTATLHEAIHAGMRVHFKYVDYDLSKGTCQRREGSMYELSPYALVWNDDNYYVFGYYERRGCVSVFRVDRMKTVEMTDIKSVEISPDFDLAEYIETKFGMFSGEQVGLDIRFSNDLINPVMDRFGMKTPIIIDGEQHFIAHVKASVSPVFYSWLFQFGDRAQILKPERIAKDYISQLSGALSKMNESALL